MLGFYHQVGRAIGGLGVIEHPENANTMAKELIFRKRDIGRSPVVDKPILSP